MPVFGTCILGAAYPAPQTIYQPPHAPYTPPPLLVYSTPPPLPSLPCPDDKVRDAIGNCVQPEVSRDLFVFQEPVDNTNTGTDRPIPKPKVKLNLLVIRTAHDQRKKPIIVPPPLQRNLVLVLSKKGDNSKKVIEVPTPPGQQPEVFFIDYEEGENPLLPGGIYLQDALQHAVVETGSEGELSTLYQQPVDIGPIASTVQEGPYVNSIPQDPYGTIFQ